MSLFKKLLAMLASMLFVFLVVPSNGILKGPAVPTMQTGGTEYVSSSSSGCFSSPSFSSSSAPASQPERLTLSKQSLTIAAGKTAALSVKSGTQDGSPEWKSSDSSVATVDGKGKITAVKQGKCIIKATLPDGRSCTCAVTVSGREVDSVRLSQKSVRLMVGHSAKITASVSPNDAADKALNWKSSNPSVASVDSNGKITARKTGECVVTASSRNSKSASCSVTVTEPVAVHSVKLSRTSVSLVKGKTYTLKATVSPSNATVKTLKWESSNTSVATVNSAGKVTAKGVGKCSITASASNYKMALCSVTVSAPAVLSTKPDGEKPKTPPKEPVLEIETPPNEDGYYSGSILVKGYALNASGVSSVKIYLDTVGSSGYVGKAEIGIKRSDIASQYPSGYKNNGTSGFQYTMDIGGLKFASSHTLYVVAAGNDGTKIQKSVPFLAGNVVYTSYSVSLSSAIAVQSGKTPALQVSGIWEFAKKIAGVKGYYKGSTNTDNWIASDSEYDKIIGKLSYYIDPSNFINDPVQKYQFLKLSYVNCATSAQLDAVFKGSLSGHGEDFMTSAKSDNINPVYLAGHAVEETGNGSSQLACGVYVEAGSYSAGVVEKSDTYYNLFGIHASDKDPVATGSQYAAVMGWNTVQKAIDGGARWISGNYINNSDYHQDTVYKMRWNPEHPGVHQYATDVRWAYNQMSGIKTCFDYFSGVKLIFDLPQYAK